MQLVRDTLPEQTEIPSFKVTETASHYMLRLEIRSRLCERLEIELDDEDLTITSRGRPLEAHESPWVSIKAKTLSLALAAQIEGGVLMVALPKRTMPLEW